MKNRNSKMKDMVEKKDRSVQNIIIAAILIIIWLVFITFRDLNTSCSLSVLRTEIILYELIVATPLLFNVIKYETSLVLPSRLVFMHLPLAFVIFIRLIGGGSCV